MLITLLKMFFNIPIYLLVKLIPKDANLSVIGASLGKHFADNSKYFYIYFHKIKKDKHNKLVWITKNKKVFKLLNSYDLPVEYLYSLKGLCTAVRASKVFLSHQLGDIYGPLIYDANIIQLWHGFPLKKIGHNGDWSSDGLIGKIKYLIYKMMPFNYYMSCDKLIAPSSLAKENLKEAFSLSFNNEKRYKDILVLGYPRNDVFSSSYTFDNYLFPEIQILKQYKKDFKHIVSWLPTQRKALDKNILDIIKESSLDLAKLNSYCQKNDILFVFKPHFLDIDILESNIKEYKNLTIYDNADPYPLLKFTDILLTDYSSVFFDFIITQKPIIFTPFDYEEYLLKVNFYQNYNEITPAVKCHKWDNILENITLILKNEDAFAERRKLFLKEQNISNNSSELIYNTFFKEHNEC